MNYFKLTFSIEPTAPVTDILIAELGENGFESFEETKSGCIAYVQEGYYSKEAVENLVRSLETEAKIHYSEEFVPSQNWNEEWEKNFAPIIINEQAIIRASFHPSTHHHYQFIISPRMAFGTGHHETTRMMARALFHLDLKGKKVLDMGCGTGILAVIAEKLGASQVVGIDIEAPAVENSREHFSLNSCTRCEALLGDAHLLEENVYDVILANINRNVLTRDMAFYARALKGQGLILFSGFFTSDQEIIDAAATKEGLSCVSADTENNWARLTYSKNR